MIHLDEIDSTQDEAFRRAAAGAKDRTVIVARRQTAGRGRHGREWLSAEGNLHFSILLRETRCDRAIIPLLVGLGICDALDVDAKIKWPNDIIVDDRKLAGILCESRQDVVVVGVGINVAFAPLPTAIALRAVPDVERLVAAINARLEHGEVPDEINARLCKGAAIHDGAQIVIDSIAPDGSLIAMKNGRRVEIRSGELAIECK